MTTFARSTSCLALATASVVAAMALDVAAASRAIARVPVSAGDTGRPNAFVNRPGCWTEGGYELRTSCEAVTRDQ